MRLRKSTSIVGYITDADNPYDCNSEYEKWHAWFEAHYRGYYMHGHWRPEAVANLAARRGLKRYKFTHSFDRVY